MTRRKTRNYSSDHFQCCMICCAPALGLSICFENLLKCICCCPITPTIPNDIAIPIDEVISDRNYDKILVD